MTLATNLRQLRQARGMTQYELADRSGVTQAQISLIENGRASPRAATVLALAKALKFAPAKLFAGTTTKRKTP